MQDGTQAVLELRKLRIHVVVALRAQAAGLRRRVVHQAVRLLVRTADDLGLGDESLLFCQPLVHGTLVFRVGGLEDAVRFPLGVAYGRIRHVPSLVDHPVGLVLRVSNERSGLGLRIAEHGFRLGVRVAENALRVLLCGADQHVGAVLRPPQDLVLFVQNVLRVVEVDGDGVPEVVEKPEHLVAGHHAIGGHRHAVGLLQGLN